VGELYETKEKKMKKTIINIFGIAGILLLFCSIVTSVDAREDRDIKVLAREYFDSKTENVIKDALKDNLLVKLNMILESQKKEYRVVDFPSDSILIEVASLENLDATLLSIEDKLGVSILGSDAMGFLEEQYVLAAVDILNIPDEILNNDQKLNNLSFASEVPLPEPKATCNVCTPPPISAEQYFDIPSSCYHLDGGSIGSCSYNVVCDYTIYNPDGSFFEQSVKCTEGL
jgi:hypothetical protein